MAEDAARRRLDQEVTARGLAPSRARARDLIRRGLVRVDGIADTRPGRLVSPTHVLDVASAVAGDISRGAEKLRAGLDAFGLSPSGLTALDIGASTGGFTQVLLENGAARVIAVDVGRGQLHDALVHDDRVMSWDGIDARALTPEMVPGPIGAVVADVSFVSVIKVLGPALDLAAPGAWLVVLVKPQFEVGPDGVGKGGIVRDAKLRADALERVKDWLTHDMGWTVIGERPSPITGSDGNIEWLVGARKAT